MATLSHADSRRSYYWWWDGHAVPKNSKWLQENITDMDGKLQKMVKLLEEDADSFARRAEMYYKKRPELMKLVEEFYRAYRALAERYDHATGALRQAHQTIAEAFPNQIPFLLPDDLPSASSVSEVERQKPHQARATLDSNDLQKDALGLSSSHIHAIRRSSAYSNESDSATSKKGLKQLNELFASAEGPPHPVKSTEGRMMTGLNHHGDEKNDLMKEKTINKPERADKVEIEVQILKDSLAKLEAEKEAGLIQYQNASERLSNLEGEVSRAQEDARGLNDRASKAATEVQTLNEAIIKLQAEKEAGFLQYQQCMERMSNLENKILHVQDAGLNDRAIKVETEVQNLKQALARLEAEKEGSLVLYNQCVEKISMLEAKVTLAEEKARNLNERAVRAETEVLFLKETTAKLNEEKEAAALQYQRSFETISTLQSELSQARDEATRLSSVIVMGVAKLNSTEEQYYQLEREHQSLQSEVETLVEMMELQKQELSEKDEELDRLQICIEEEDIRTMEAESALQTLQSLHSKCQEEREALLLEVENGLQKLKDKELECQGLEEAMARVKEENEILNKQSVSLAVPEKNFQDEISRLRSAEMKLGKEVEGLVDQRNYLQEEIYNLKKEINDLKKRHLDVVEQMELVGLKPDSLGSFVKSLHDENSRMTELCQKHDDEKGPLLEKLKNMESLLENNALLENSLLDMNVRLQLLREKVKALEQTCQSLKNENSTVAGEKEYLISQLEVANSNVEKLSRKNTSLENFIFDASVECAWLREKSRSLEEVCNSLDSEKSDLFTANGNLVSQFKIIQQELDDLVRKYTDLEEENSCLVKELESRAHQIAELRDALKLENQEHASFIHSSETQLAHLEGDNHILRTEVERRISEFEDEQDKALIAQLEIFILQRSIRDMEERSLALFSEYQKQVETSKSSENLVTNLEKENVEQKVKVNLLLDQVEKLRFGIHQMGLSLKINPVYEEDQTLLEMAMEKIKYLESSLWSSEDEKYQLLFEKSVLLTLLGHLRSEAAYIESERSALDKDLKLRTEDLLLLQIERNELKSTSDRLNHQIGIGNDTLSKKEMELEQTKQKLKAVENDNMEFSCKLEDMNSECNEVRLAREVLEKQILEISESNSQKNREIGCLHEAADMLELDLSRLHDELEEQRVREENLSSELQQKRDEIELWEYEAETLYHSFQVTSIHETLLREKVHELVRACESVEDSKSKDIKALKERVLLLELENKGVKSELAAYLPGIVSLRDGLVSLEDHVFSNTKNQDTEVADVASHQHDHANKEPNESLSLLAKGGVLELLELHNRIKRIGSSVVEQKRVAMQESFDKRIKLEAAMKEIQKLEQAGNGSSNRMLQIAEDVSEVGNEILVKDIPLDQVSHCSSYDHGYMPPAMSRRDVEGYEEIMELWKPAQQDLEFDEEHKLQPVPTEDKSNQIESVEHKNEYPSEIHQEDDNLKILERLSYLDLEFNQQQKLQAVPSRDKNSVLRLEQVEEKTESSSEIHQGGENRKILERLASDSQKLTNLQLTVQDLNKKVEQLEKYKMPKDAEFSALKGRLEEVEDATMQLQAANEKLSKQAERRTMVSDGKVTINLDKRGKSQRNRISERARRSSERIGRVQLEVQRIQFDLLRLEDRYKAKGTAADRKVRLRDYFYGNLRSTTIKRKKRMFFSCVKPLSKVD